MSKAKYVAPIMEITVLEAADIITTSGDPASFDGEPVRFNNDFLLDDNSSW